MPKYPNAQEVRVATLTNNRYTAERLDALVEQFYAGHSNPSNHEPMRLINGSQSTGDQLEDSIDDTGTSSSKLPSYAYTSIQELRLRTIKEFIRKLDILKILHEYSHLLDLDPQGLNLGYVRSGEKEAISS
jgi:hypothetical protein